MPSWAVDSQAAVLELVAAETTAAAAIIADAVLAATPAV